MPYAYCFVIIVVFCLLKLGRVFLQTDTRLAAPLLNEPFTRGEIGVLMRRGQNDLLEIVNGVIRRMKSDGTLRRLHEKYGLVYAY